MVQSISSRTHAELKELLRAYQDEYIISAQRKERQLGRWSWVKIKLTRGTALKPRDQRAISLLLSVTEYLDKPGFHTSLKSMLSAWIVNETTVLQSSQNSGDISVTE